MISTIVRKDTFNGVRDGAKTELVFERKPYWERRLGSKIHRAILLLNARRCRCFLIKRIEISNDEFRVTLGGAYTWPRQMGLFREQ